MNCPREYALNSCICSTTQSKIIFSTVNDAIFGFWLKRSFAAPISNRAMYENHWPRFCHMYSNLLQHISRADMTTLSYHFTLNQFNSIEYTQFIASADCIGSTLFWQIWYESFQICWRICVNHGVCCRMTDILWHFEIINSTITLPMAFNFYCFASSFKNSNEMIHVPFLYRFKSFVQLIPKTILTNIFFKVFRFYSKKILINEYWKSFLPSVRHSWNIVVADERLHH